MKNRNVGSTTALRLGGLCSGACVRACVFVCVQARQRLRSCSQSDGRNLWSLRRLTAVPKSHSTQVKGASSRLRCAMYLRRQRAAHGMRPWLVTRQVVRRRRSDDEGGGAVIAAAEGSEDRSVGSRRRASEKSKVFSESCWRCVQVARSHCSHCAIARVINCQITVRTPCSASGQAPPPPSRVASSHCGSSRGGGGLVVEEEERQEKPKGP